MFHKTLEIFWQSEELFASQDGHYSMKLVTLKCTSIQCYYTWHNILFLPFEHTQCNV